MVFPVIQEIIHKESTRLGRPIDRELIGRELDRHPRVADNLRREYHGQMGSFHEWCRNLVDWYSARWTTLEDEGLDPRDIVASPFSGVRRIDPGKGAKCYLYELDEAS
ncbi:MAG: hypothetical protein DLM70_18410 [Chloroflexi bacterium]|nr:MAG: hypothetical protein DLM70_18410 [Chloroflexota bacterium]